MFTNEMTPKNLVNQAKDAYENGEFDSAAHLFAEAADAFQQAGNALDAAEMKNNQSVCLLQNGDSQASFECLAGTADLFAQAGDKRRQGMALGNEASALEALGRQDEAAEKYRASGDALMEAGEDELRATVMGSLSNMYLKRGKMVDAVWAMWSGLTGLKNPTPRQRFLKSLYSILKTLFKIRV